MTGLPPHLSSVRGSREWEVRLLASLESPTPAQAARLRELLDILEREEPNDGN